MPFSNYNLLIIILIWSFQFSIITIYINYKCLIGYDFIQHNKNHKLDYKTKHYMQHMDKNNLEFSIL